MRDSVESHGDAPGRRVNASCTVIDAFAVGDAGVADIDAILGCCCAHTRGRVARLAVARVLVLHGTLDTLSLTRTCVRADVSTGTAI